MLNWDDVLVAQLSADLPSGGKKRGHPLVGRLTLTGSSTGALAAARVK
jgi:hypothetical protein